MNAVPGKHGRQFGACHWQSTAGNGSTSLEKECCWHVAHEGWPQQRRVLKKPRLPILISEIRSWFGNFSSRNRAEREVSQVAERLLHVYQMRSSTTSTSTVSLITVLAGSRSRGSCYIDGDTGHFQMRWNFQHMLFFNQLAISGSGTSDGGAGGSEGREWCSKFWPVSAKLPRPHYRIQRGIKFRPWLIVGGFDGVRLVKPMKFY